MWKHNLRRKLSVVTLGGGLLLTAACVPTPRPVPGGSGGTTPVPVQSTNKPGIPATGTLFGLWENPGAGNYGETGEKALWTWREAQLGRKADIGHQFYPFATPFPTWRETWHIRNGRTPMISWNGTTSSTVNSGQHDGLIRTRARAVKALNTPVFLRYFWEPDAAKKDAMAQSPAAYIANWRRVHSIFQQEGVTNAAFVWCPTAWGFANGEAQTFYPGDQYVDWICADGYTGARASPVTSGGTGRPSTASSTNSAPPIGSR